MKLKKLVVSILTLVMVVTSLCPAVLAFNVNGDDGYNTNIYDWDFENSFEMKNHLFFRDYTPTEGYTKEQVAPTITTSPVENDVHGNVARVPIPAGEMYSEDRSGQRFWSLGKLVDPIYDASKTGTQDALNKLMVSKLEIDVMVDKLVDFAIRVVEYSEGSGGGGYSYSRDLVTFDAEESKMGFLSSDMFCDYQINTWYNFTFYLDYYNQTYSAYLNGECILTNHKLDNSKIFNPALFFGLSTDTAVTESANIYVDNMSYSVPTLYKETITDASVNKTVVNADYTGFTGKHSDSGETNAPADVAYSKPGDGTTGLKSYVSAATENLPDAEAHGQVLKCTLGNNASNNIGTTFSKVYASYETALPTECDLKAVQHQKFKADFLITDSASTWDLNCIYIDSGNVVHKNSAINLMRVDGTNPGYVYFRNGASSSDIKKEGISTLLAIGEWNTVELWVDYENHTYDAWLNGVLIGKDLIFTSDNGVYGLSYWFRTSDTKKTLGRDTSTYFDNFELQIGAESELKPVMAVAQDGENSYRAAYVPENGASDGVLIMAGYDNDQKLTEASLASANEEGTTLVSAINTASNSIKAFIWNSLEKLSPVYWKQVK